MSWARARRGSVSVEAAFAFAALIVIISAVLAGVVGVARYVQAVDAAGSAARWAARQQQVNPGSAPDFGLPTVSSVTFSGDDRWVRAEVRVPFHGWDISATATALREPQ